jgi:hypothetical protein
MSLLEIQPHFRALFRVLPLFRPPGISLRCLDSYLRKVLPPFRVCLTFGRYLPLQAFLTTISFLRIPWFFATRKSPLASNAEPFFTILLAPFPFWDLFPSEISPFDQRSPFRAACSHAFSQGCEALIQSKVPGRDSRKCKPGWCLSRNFSVPQFSLPPDILLLPVGSHLVLGLTRRVFPVDRPAASSRTSRPLCVSATLEGFRFDHRPLSPRKVTRSSHNLDLNSMGLLPRVRGISISRWRRLPCACCPLQSSLAS